jgi:hypothetical protein
MICFFKKNDWEIFEYHYGNWKVDVITDFGNYIEKEVCHFYIIYSKSRNKYKLKTKGHKPQTHSIYPSVLRRVIELNNANREKQIISI